MSFSTDAWTRIEPLYQEILAMTFNQELAAGTLARERFIHYMLQDAHYLLHFGKALAVTGARAPDPDAMIQFTHSAEACVLVERALHEGFFRDFGITAQQVAATRPSPACSHYTSYLLATAHNAPYEVAVAALLPCFWIYGEVGRHLLEIAAMNNPYQAWIDTYADEAFAQGIRKVIAIADRAALSTTPVIRAQMVEAFERASLLEWMFWDSAYRLEAWPFS
ncbi:MAG: thiaminase II [Rhizobiales bacterium]|nr:thiaminase II [Hyphomicrobiales bacterium]